MLLKIKIATSEPSSQLLMHLHKKTNLSISEIKSKCEKVETIYECDSADTSGLTFINKLNQEIVELGFQPKLFIDDEEFDAEVFKNIERRNIEIDEEYE